MSTDAAETWRSLAAAVAQAGDADALAVSNRVARQVQQLVEAGNLPKHVRPLRIALLRSFTAEILAPVLAARLAEYDIAATCSLGQLGNIAAECLDPGSFVHRERFDACVVMALAEHVLPDLADAGASDARQQALEAFLAQLRHLAESFAGLVIVCNLAAPAALVAPQLQSQLTTSGRYAIDAANRALAELAARHANLLVCDVAGLAARMGLDAFWSPRDMLTSMQPLSAAAMPRLARQIADLCLLFRTTPVKCIVLDCDNTLWGGIIGEDGPGGIKLGETYPGLCFQEFQRQLRDLNRMGFLLAICSKNNPADVQRVFDEHPGMVLRPEQIAAERVNWTDKVTNLQELAEELNIGLDSFVFIDDSDFEINLVREQLPMVRCLQVPRQPWLLPRLLPEARVIDRLAITAEDRKKAQMYQQERQRRQFQHTAASFETYLRGLEIRMAFEPFDPAQHLSRAAQLTQKTNQFNLTTRRFSEADISALHEAKTPIFLASLSDRFGDYGRIALAILRPGDEGVIRLDVFLMSCRVIGRGVENSFLRLILARMAAAGYRRCEAEFIPTAKNAVSREFLSGFGMKLVRRDDDGHEIYEYDLTQGVPPADDWINVRQA